MGYLRVRRKVGGSPGSSVEHRALVGLALLGGQLGGFALRKQGDNRPQRRGGSGCWDGGMVGSPGDGGDGGRRGDNFTGGGQLEGEVQHCSASTQGLQVEDCWAPLLPEVGSMAELVLDKAVGSCRPRASRPRRHPGFRFTLG